jgi:poly(A)-specific ribonuclease
MMEVNRFTFQPMLKSILEDISTAHFIALDFEFSGIHKQAYRAKKPQNSGKQTLQERYLETKAAAELYQILQVGLTCVVEDLENGSYELKPYNFNLSPLMTEKGLEIDRDIILQGSGEL